MSVREGSCEKVINFNENCGGHQCPKCMSIYVYNDTLGIMARLSVDDEYLSMSSYAESCGQFAADPIFGEECNGEECPQCLPLHVYHKPTNSMQQLILSGESSFVSNEPGSCGELPVVIEWGNDCGDGACSECLSYCVHDEEDNAMKRVVMNLDNLHVSRKPGSCASLPELGENINFGADCEGGECSDCLTVNVYNGYTFRMDKLILNNGNGFQVGKSFESCAAAPSVGPGVPSINWENECEGTCPNCMSLHVHDGVDNVMRKVIFDGQDAFVGSIYESCASAPIVSVPDPHVSPIFGKVCDGPCPNCLGLNVYDMNYDEMRVLKMGGGTVSVGNAPGSCAQVPSVPNPTVPDPHVSPSFGKTCTVDCPNCLGLRVYDSYNDVMEIVKMGGGTVSMGNTLGSCAQVPVVDPVPTVPTVPTVPVNTEPVANAGANQSVKVGDIVTLDGGNSSDANNDILNYHWTFISKPVGSSAVIWLKYTIDPTFLADIEGAYVLGLIVNDGSIDSVLTSTTVNAVNATHERFIPVGNTGVMIMDGNSSKELMVFI